MSSSAVSLKELEFLDPAIYERDGYPHEVWRRLRAEAPVLWVEKPDFHPFWAVTKYKDVDFVVRNPAYFSATVRNLIHNYEPPPGEELTAPRAMNFLDPPEHERWRRLVSKGFTPRHLSRVEPLVRELITGILDDIAPRGECEFVSSIAVTLPLAVISELVGIPREDWQTLFLWISRNAHNDEADVHEPGVTPEESAYRSRMAMFEYCARLAEKRRDDPRDDLMTVLATAEIDGRPLTGPEIGAFCWMLLLAGNQTIRSAIGGGMYALTQFPEQRQRLIADPSLIPTAMEEVVRWWSPLIHSVSLAIKDVELSGQHVKPGDWVAVWWASANRDEDIFPDPNRFDAGRRPNEHLGYSVGQHYCLGANLARLELKVVFEELLARLPDIELAGELQHVRSVTSGGIKRMPVRFTPRPVRS